MSQCDYAIVHRSFWPESEIIGESLLQLAENLAKQSSVVTIFQGDRNFFKVLNAASRGKGVCFDISKSRSNSASSILYRGLDAILFSLSVGVSLLKRRPKKIYVSTDPPIFVPFVVALYSLIFNARFVYHLQDIHPEATSVVSNRIGAFYRLFKWIDSISVRNANKIITLTDQMAQYISLRNQIKKDEIFLLENAAVISDEVLPVIRKPGLVFVGNLGRLQRIPLIIKAIRRYRSEGGGLPFFFAGGGVYSRDIQKLAGEVTNLSYLGKISAVEANKIQKQYSWALLPIEDKVLNFAFPSKTSTYLVNGINVLSVSKPNSSVSNWVKCRGIGFNSEPNEKSIVDAFFQIEESTELVPDNIRSVDCYTIPSHVKQLLKTIIST